MRQKKGSYVTCEVSGTACGSEDGTYDVKTLHGSHAVLLRASTAAPSRSSFSSSGSPLETCGGLPERLTGFTICAVDARGCFAVEQGGTYEIGAVLAIEEQTVSEAASDDAQRAPAAASKVARERMSTKKETRRALTKYGLFLSQFSKMFRTKGFKAGAEEWRRLSAESKKSNDVDALIAAVVRLGRHPLRSSQS
ncbi:hypothetical protein CUR178_05789 [Leishmania enriettii]|uniref:Uncharacterized protein n=1 Tax=Leishmania enriettii TaxID=5663 RepID=A0A836HPN4_LEIEN|nr:hypothetical protein CUR178_05789 [Leishmania enriettii]